MKKYKAIFFDWDGTAVTSRTGEIDSILKPMIDLLHQGIQLIIISGTTYNNIANGKLHEYIPKSALPNLYLGLGRGAYNYGFDAEGNLVTLKDSIPSADDLLKLHDTTYAIHHKLLKEFNLATDIVFSRPNYCKLDLLVFHDRKEQLYMHNNEVDLLNNTLKQHGYNQGIIGLMEECKSLGLHLGLDLKLTTDAKHLEIGFTTKTDNIEFFIASLIKPHSISLTECSFWGDEFSYIAEGIAGSDAQMLSSCSKEGDFFDVSNTTRLLPEGVQRIGGGTQSFIAFLLQQSQEV